MNEPNAGAPWNLNTTTRNTIFCHARMCKQLGVLGLHPVATGPSGPHREDFNYRCRGEGFCSTTQTHIDPR